jgi:hypothetical protein
MSKKIAPPRKSRLHFERVPVAEVVKKIAPEAATPRTNGTRSLPAEPGPRPRGRSGHFHGVHFYNDPAALCAIVGDFLGEGFAQGDLALIIATPSNVAGIESSLRARGIDIDNLIREGRLATLDARETMRLFMTNQTPNPGMFRRVVTSALTELRRGRKHDGVRAYGEMVDLLWKDGVEAAAIRLETLWNQLGTSLDFKLLCGYSMGNFYKGPAIEEIHDRHSHVIADAGTATVMRDLQVAPAALP